MEYLANEGGTVSGEANQTVEKGRNATEVVAVANTGYKFVKWSDGIETAERTDKNITADKTVTAIFERLNYAVTFLSNGNGHIDGVANQTVNYGESATTVTAVPNEGCKFVKWSDGIETAERTDRIVTANKTVTAIFEKFTFDMKYETDGNGYIVGKANQSVGYGENAVKVTAIPNNGYKFVKWSDGVESDVRQDLNVKENVAVTAEFEFLFASGNGERANPFIIKNYQQLLSMRAYPDQFYRLANDLDLAGIDHEPLFDDNEPFSGYFDGNGKTIDNLTVETEKNYPSLFGFIFDGIVTDFNLCNVQITTTDFNTDEAGTTYCVGAVAGYSVGFLNNISVEGEITVDGLTYDGVAVGGLAGMAYSTVADCVADMHITVKNVKREHETNMSQPFLFGGLLGVCDSAHIRNCNAQGEISVSDSCYDIYVGGLIGYYFTDMQVETEIINSQTNIAITQINSNCHSGGFVGYLETAKNTTLLIANCSVIGNITGDYIGGFVYNGYSYGNLLIENCYVDNEITGYSGAAAAGFINSYVAEINNCKIQNCHVLSNIAINSYSGDAWGFAYQISGINIRNSYSTGSVSSGRGGGFGWMISNCYIEQCYSDCKVETVFACAAFVYALTNSEMINCYSQNTFEKEPTISGNLSITVIMVIRNSKISKYYYSGNLIEKVFKEVTNSEIMDFHCMKSDKLTSELIDVDRGDLPSSIDITVYESKEDMYNLAEKLNNGSTEEVWANQDNDFPKFKII